jgi:hypothetical protein
MAQCIGETEGYHIYIVQSEKEQDSKSLSRKMKQIKGARLKGKQRPQTTAVVRAEREGRPAGPPSP